MGHEIRGRARRYCARDENEIIGDHLESLSLYFGLCTLFAIFLFVCRCLHKVVLVPLDEGSSTWVFASSSLFRSRNSRRYETRFFTQALKLD